MRSVRSASIVDICLKTMRPVPKMIDQDWRRPCPLFNQATFWWSGNWIGWGARCRIRCPLLIHTLKEKKVTFRSPTGGMDITSASGELLFHISGAVAQYERALTQERVVAGLSAA